MVSSNTKNGFTLVELMVAMTLGLLIVLGVIQVMMSNQISYRTNDELSRIQENGRFALDLLANDIRMAGYQGQVNTADSIHFFLNTVCDLYDPCTKNGDGISSDRIAIQFDPENDRDCTGSSANISAKDIIANVYFITKKNAVSTLKCRGWNASKNQWVASAQPLLDGIDNMQLLYGVKGNDGIEGYVSADRVGDWSALQAVRVALLVSNGHETGGAENKKRSYVLLDSPVVELTDKHFRKVYSSTFNLNNAF